MASNKLSDEHSLLRYVPWSKLRKAEDGETVVGVLGAAFELRKGEPFLSATWIEHFADLAMGLPVNQAVRAVRNSNLGVTPKSGFNAIRKILQRHEGRNSECKAQSEQKPCARAAQSVTFE